mgnify:CR=1 FL=1
MRLQPRQFQQIIVLALIAGLGMAATADGAPRRRTAANSNTHPTTVRRVPSSASIFSQGQAPTRRRGQSSTTVPSRNFGLKLEVRPNVASPQPRPWPRPRPTPPTAVPLNPTIVGNPRPQPPGNGPTVHRPRPRPSQPPSFQPPTRVPTLPPIVTTPPRRPRPTVPTPTINKFPNVPPGDTQKPTRRPLVVVAKDIEENANEKPLGKLPPAVGKDGIPSDPTLADKLSQFDKPSKEALDALKDAFGPNFQDKFSSGQLDALINSDFGQQNKLGQQWKVKASGGDVAMALGLHKSLLMAGGWKHAPCLGPIGPGFVGGCFGMPYCGPCYFPGHVWCPHWCGWMNFGCWHTCHWYFHPAPYCCHPLLCDPCGPWVFWDCPVWAPLHWNACGTWWNVPIVHLPANGQDLQLLSVRYIDSGHPEQDEGARYRVSIRSNSTKVILRDFNVMIFGGNDEVLRKGLPQSGARVKSIAPGEVLTFDLRLPAEANSMSIDEHGRAVPFKYLHVLVDSHREVPEVFEKNNGAALKRQMILPVDPSAFAVDTNAAGAGEEITIAGEGFGGMPGKVVVFLGDVSFEAEITGWYDLAARVKLPAIPLAGPADTEVVVMRRDGAAANPLTLRLLPNQAVTALEPPTP